MIARILRAFAVPIGLLFAATEVSPTDELAAEADKPDGEKRKRRSVTGYYTLLESPDLGKEIVHTSLETQGFVLAQGQEQGGGGGALIRRGRLVIEVSGSGADGSDVNGRGYGFGSVQFGLGLIFIQTGFMRIYPLVGVGGMGFSNDPAQSPGGDAADLVRAGAGGMLATAGLGIDFRLKLWRFSVMLGLRMGFGAVLGAEVPGTDVTSGPFFRVVTGPGVGF